MARGKGAGSGTGGATDAAPGDLRRLERERVGPLPVWGWGVLTGLLLWVLYWVTLAPSTAFWDTSEYIATAHILGIPHPPGNPFFVILGRTWDVALSWTGLSVAQRINLLSATMSAGSAVFWFLTVVRVWNHFTEDRRIQVAVAFLGVFIAGTAYTVWFQSNVNEKVYTVSLLFVALVTYLAMRWEDLADTERGDRMVLGVAFLLGLGATNHLMSLLPLAALGVFLVWHRWRHLLRWKLLVGALAFGIVGYSLQIFFPPIRSAQNPVIDEGNPECESLAAAVPTAVNQLPVLGAAVPESAVCPNLNSVIQREQYRKPPLTERQAPFTAQLANYWQYFDWQWARSLGEVPRAGVTMLFLFLGLVGIVRHWQGDRDSAVYLLTYLLTVTLILVYYLNFRYGYSLYPEIPADQHEVRERDYFFIASFQLWGIYAGMGLVTLWQRLAELVGGPAGPGGAGAGEGAAGGSGAAGAGRSPASGAGGPGDGAGAGRGTGGLLRGAPILLVALVPLVLNWERVDRTGDYTARDWAYNLLQSVEPYGILFTNGDNDTFPLWYLQEVEGIRQDVTVVVHSYLGTDWYPAQIRDLTAPCGPDRDPTARPTVVVCQRPFEADEAVAPYAGRTWQRPERAGLDLTNEQIRGIPPYQVLQDSTVVRFADGLHTTLPPQTQLIKPDLLVYRIARSSLGDRPVYFASTSPPVYSRWELQPHLLRQGLAHKMVPGIMESTTDTVELSRQFGVRWIDVDRTRSLLWDVFQIEYLLDWPLWLEPSTRSSIPTQYYLGYMALGEAQRLRNDQDRAQANYARAAAFLDLAGFAQESAGAGAPPE